MSLIHLSPLDGRYQDKVSLLQPIFSEFGLMRYRLQVEMAWLIFICEHPAFEEVQKLDKTQVDALQAIYHQFSLAEAEMIKQIEKTTNHDVKAIEYYIQEKLTKLQLSQLIPFVHFACTSEDINNLSYALMLKEGRTKILPYLRQLIETFEHLATATATHAMLSRTHGQAASPTTLGKEMQNFAYRLHRQFLQLQDIPMLGKFNGAVGNYNAHVIAYPNANWLQISEEFVKSLGLTWNPYTTQIEPHDYIAEVLQNLTRANTILIQANRDIWGYISLSYFTQQKVAQETGSSTMPHKVNPIDFENSEGNLGLANAIAQHLAEKLPISRWQRDLTDSTLLRNLGTVFGYSLLAYQSCLKGLQKLNANPKYMEQELNQHWEVLGEAVQTVLRRYGHHDAYEQLKAFTRGENITEQGLKTFIGQLNLPKEVIQTLLTLTPNTYIGLATLLANKEKISWD